MTLMWQALSPEMEKSKYLIEFFELDKLSQNKNTINPSLNNIFLVAKDKQELFLNTYLNVYWRFLCVKQ